MFKQLVLRLYTKFNLEYSHFPPKKHRFCCSACAAVPGVAGVHPANCCCTWHGLLAAH